MILYLDKDYKVYLSWNRIVVEKNESRFFVIPPNSFTLFFPFYFFLRILRLDFNNVHISNELIYFFFLGKFWVVHIKTNDIKLSFSEFKGKKPLYTESKNNEKFYWGEYFSNKERKEDVNVYEYSNKENKIRVFYTFKRGEIRHIHGIVRLDQSRLMVLCGDYGDEAKMVVVSNKGEKTDEYKGLDQLHRAVVGVQKGDWFYYFTDTQLEQNYLCRIDLKTKKLQKLHKISGPVFHSSHDGDFIYFGTCVEFGLPETKKSYLYAYNTKKDILKILKVVNLPFSVNKLSQRLFGIPCIQAFTGEKKIIFVNKFRNYAFYESYSYDKKQ